MCAGVITVLSLRNQANPLFRPTTCETTKIHLDCSIDHFDLLVSLRVIRRTKVEVGSLRVKKLSPKNASEGGISITYDAFRQAIQFKDCWKKTWAIKVAEYGWERGIKCDNLESQSTTTKITHFPFELGRPSTKSIDISVHTCVGIKNGYKNPAGLRFSPLCLWQVSQLLIYFRKKILMPCQ